MSMSPLSPTQALAARRATSSQQQCTYEKSPRSVANTIITASHYSTHSRSNSYSAVEPGMPVSSGSSGQHLPSYNSVQAEKARVATYKTLNHNIQLLSSQKQTADRALAHCAREASALSYVVQGVVELAEELREKQLQQQRKLVVIGASASSFGGVDGAGGSSSPSPRSASHLRGQQSDSTGKPPFTFYGPQLDAFFDRSMSPLQQQQQQQQRSPSRASLSPHQLNINGSGGGGGEGAIAQLSGMESVHIFHHGAVLETLHQSLFDLAKAAERLRLEMAQAKLRLEHMKLLVERTLDGEVQVLHGAFPDGNPARRSKRKEEEEQQQHAINRAGHQDSDPVLFVSAAQLFPEMTMHDFPIVVEAMSTLNVKAADLVQVLKRGIEESKKHAQQSSKSMKGSLSRGVKTAKTKHDCATLSLIAAVNEERDLLHKRAALSAKLKKLQDRIDEVEKAIKLRANLNIPLVTSPPRATTTTTFSSNSQRGVSPRPVAVHHSRSFSATAAATTNGDVDDLVTNTLRQELSSLHAQVEALMEKTAKLDKVLKAIAVDKKYLKGNISASVLRSAACTSVAEGATATAAAGSKRCSRSPSLQMQRIEEDPLVSERAA